MPVGRQGIAIGAKSRRHFRNADVLRNESQHEGIGLTRADRQVVLLGAAVEVAPNPVATPGAPIGRAQNPGAALNAALVQPGPEPPGGVVSGACERWDRWEADPCTTRSDGFEPLTETPGLVSPRHVRSGHSSALCRIRWGITLTYRGSPSEKRTHDDHRRIFSPRASWP